MCSPISPTFADIVMEDLETAVLSDLKHNHNCVPLFYFRHVDDTILYIKEDELDIVLKKFNSYDRHL